MPADSATTKRSTTKRSTTKRSTTKRSTTKRSYEARLDIDKDQKSILESTLDAYCKGARAALRVLFAFSASIRPTDDIPSVFVGRDKETGGNIKTVRQEWTPVLACLTNWYTLVANLEPDDLKYQVEAVEIEGSFRSRWVLEGGDVDELEDPVLLSHFKSLGLVIEPTPGKIVSANQREGSIWVDRYAQGYAFLAQIEFPREDAFDLIKWAGWPFLLLSKDDEVNNDKANTISRNFLSLLWGDDEKKGPWYKFVEFYRGVLSVFNSWDCFDCPIDDFVGKFPSLPTPWNGPPSKIKIIIGKYEEDIKQPDSLNEREVEDIKKQVQKALEKAIQRVKTNLPVEGRSLLRKYMECETKVPYITCGGTRRIDVYGQFFSLAMAGMGSWKSNWRNQMFARCEAASESDVALRKTGDLIPEVSLTVREYMDETGQRYLHKYQFKGFREIVGYITEDGLSVDEAIREAKTEGDIGDPNLFDKLASLPQGVFLNSLPSLNIMVKIDEAYESLETLKYPTYNLERPYCPWFGVPEKSLPSGEVLLECSGGKFQVRINLLKGSEDAPLILKARSKRVTKELLSKNPDSVDAPRNHRLFEIQKGGSVNPTIDPSQITIQLFKRDDKFYAKLCVTLDRIVPPVKDIKEKKDLRIFAVDIGYRNAAGWALLERTNEGKNSVVVFKPDKTDGMKDEFFKVLNTGLIGDWQSIDPEEGRVDRLTTCDRLVTVDQIEFLESVDRDIAALVPDDRKDRANHVPTSFSELSQALAWRVKRLVSAFRKPGSVLDIKIVTDLSKKIADFLVPHSPNSGTTSDTWRLRGGLSIRRLETLEDFRRSYVSLVKLHQDRDLEPPLWLVEAEARLAKKRVSRKRERAKIIVSRIMGEALKLKADIIVLEKLNLNTSKNHSRAANRRLANWTHSQILSNIKEACELHGIFLKEVNPWNTSLWDSTVPENNRSYNRDYLDQATRCRLTMSYPDNLAKCISGSFTRVESNFKKMCCAYYEYIAQEYGILVDRYNTTELAQLMMRDSIPIPAYKGDLYLVRNPECIPETSRVGSYIDSDINAAINIGIISARSLFGFDRKESKKKTKKVLQS